MVVRVSEWPRSFLDRSLRFSFSDCSKLQSPELYQEFANIEWTEAQDLSHLCQWPYSFREIRHGAIAQLDHVVFVIDGDFSPAPIQ